MFVPEGLAKFWNPSSKGLNQVFGAWHLSATWPQQWLSRKWKALGMLKPPEQVKNWEIVVAEPSQEGPVYWMKWWLCWLCQVKEGQSIWKKNLLLAVSNPKGQPCERKIVIGCVTKRPARLNQVLKSMMNLISVQWCDKSFGSMLSPKKASPCNWVDWSCWTKPWPCQV